MADETQTSEPSTDTPAPDAQRTEAEAAAAAAQAAGAEAAKVDEGKKPAPTIAGGAPAAADDAGAGKPAEADPAKPAADTAWPDDWRQRLAGDNKKTLKTLERFTSPDQMLGSYLDMRSRFDSGEFIRKPGKDATDEERAAFAKAMGVPEKPEAYVENLTLPEGVVLSKPDKDVLGDFATYAHKAGAPQGVVDAAANWYLDYQKQQADTLDKADREAATKHTEELRAEWRGDFDRNVSAGQMLFKDAPGGTAADGDGLFARLMNGRMADGTVVGNDPQMLRWMASLGREVYPAATVSGGTDGTPGGVDQRIREIEGWMKSSDPVQREKYWKDDKTQNEYRELLDARQKMTARRS